MMDHIKYIYVICVYIERYSFKFFLIFKFSFNFNFILFQGLNVGSNVNK